MDNKELEVLAAANFNVWNEALLSRKPENVAALYDESNSFLPTMAGDFRRGCDRVKDYFVHFLAKNPNGTIVEGRVQELSDDSYLHSGLYDFEVDSQDVGRETVHARFSYVWKMFDGEWRIIHHHSSARP